MAQLRRESAHPAKLRVSNLHPILVVDDTPGYRLLLRAQLKSLGYSTIEASDGCEALAVLEREAVLAVVSDILMPRMDGYRLCHEIRSRPALRELPVLVFTNTYVSPEDQQLAMRAGADAYLVKPAPLPLLRSTLEEIIRRNTQAQPREAAPQETVMLEYNAVLVQKLEEKSRETAARNADLSRLNAELAQQRAAIEGILRSASDAILTVDGSGTVVLFNSAAERLLGVAATAAVGHPLANVLPDAIAERIQAVSVPAGSSLFQLSSGSGALTVEATISRLDAEGRRLTTMILRDVTARQQADRETRELSEQLRALAIRLEAVREEERTHIAREIHDILAQELTSLKIDLLWAAKRAAQPLDDATQLTLAQRLQRALTQIDSSITTVQRIATELRPAVLDSLGLSAAIEWQAEDFSQRTGIVCTASTPGLDMPDPGKARATALFRILQESLTNVARHSGASRVTVGLEFAAGALVLTVQDNGRGITPAQIADPLSIGLIGMRERVQAHGGSIRLDPNFPSGTVVTVNLPLPSPSPA